MSNTGERIGAFAELTNEYLFQGFLPLVLLIIVVVLLYVIWKRKYSFTDEALLLGIMAVTAAGYLLAVSKTALLLGDSSVRYILPIFGVLLLTVAATFVKLQEWLENGRFLTGLLVGILCFILVGGGAGMLNGKILFLFPEGAQRTAYAEVHALVPAVYYNN